jgi:signal peptidase I
VDQAPTEPAAPAAGVPDEAAPPRSLGWLVELAKTLVLTLLIFFGVQTFVAQPFQVQMHSMEATFWQGDYVLVDKLSVRWDDYSRGDVVVFQPPPSWTDGTDPYIKRVIGEPGDTIEVRDDGLVYVNGAALDEPYLFADEDGVPEPTLADDGASWVVPEGELFVMGDHRRSSADSRAFGPIPISSVIGRGAIRYWPLGSFGFITAPAYEGFPRRGPVAPGSQRSTAWAIPAWSRASAIEPDGIAPSRRITGRSTEQSTTVDAGPPRIGPPSSTSASASPSRSAISRASRASGSPDRLAEVVGRGPSSSASARGAGWSGTRTPIVGVPAASTVGRTASGRTGSTNVSPPGQNRSPSTRAAGVSMPSVHAWATSARSTATAFSGGRRLAANSRSIASGSRSQAAIP